MTDFEAPHSRRAASSDTEDRDSPIDNESIGEAGHQGDTASDEPLPMRSINPEPEVRDRVYERDIYGDERGGQVPKRP